MSDKAKGKRQFIAKPIVIGSTKGQWCAQCRVKHRIRFDRSYDDGQIERALIRCPKQGFWQAVMLLQPVERQPKKTRKP